MTLDFTTLGKNGKNAAAGGGDGSSPEKPLVVTQQTLQRLVADSATKLVVLHAHLEGGTDSPVMHTIAKSLRPEVPVLFAIIDARKNQFLVQQMGLNQLPAVVLLIQQQIVGILPSKEPADRVRAYLAQLFGPQALAAPEEEDAVDDVAEALAAAEQARGEGALAEAAEIFGAILAREPENLKALAGLARCHIELGNFDQARQILALVPPAGDTDQDVSSARAALELAEKGAEAAGRLGDLRQRVAANPKDHEARYQLAVALNATGDREAAVDELLSIMRADRAWNDEAARRQLVELFEAWGPKDPMTIDGRRRLSSLLFS
ncbi:MAG: tetratricopeptide repeat protein [Rhizobiales bacterium]|nr:tetratricopeptide repeat protein [Hyphomicrobiales bacterium]